MWRGKIMIDCSNGWTHGYYSDRLKGLSLSISFFVSLLSFLCPVLHRLEPQTLTDCPDNAGQSTVGLLFGGLNSMSDKMTDLVVIPLWIHWWCISHACLGHSCLVCTCSLSHQQPQRGTRTPGGCQPVFQTHPDCLQRERIGERVRVTENNKQVIVWSSSNWYFVIFPLAIKSVFYIPGLQMSKVPMRPEL